MKFGYFDNKNKEYVITRPDTPRPWSNYLGSAEFGTLITNNAVAYTFYKSAAQGRLSRFRFNAPPADMPGKFVYLRDDEDKNLWSNSWMPCRKDLKKFLYSCRFGTGYAIIASEFSGISSQTTYFVPLGQLYEIWSIEIKNNSKKTRKISVFPFIETQCNWNANDDATNLQYIQYIARTEIIADRIIDIGSNVNMPEDKEHFTNKDQKRHLFFAIAGAKPSSFDSNLEKFLGTYGSYSEPEAILKGKCSNSTIWGGNPCGAFQIKLKLEAGEVAKFAIVFGVGQAKDATKLLKKVEEEDYIPNELKKLKEHWTSRISSFEAKTPEKDFNSMVNLWSPYNNLMTFYWSRTASMIYAGERDGLGFRDTVQDIVGASSLIQEEARERLELMITGQLSNGGALPVVKPFSHNPGSEKGPSNYRADDCLWFFNALPQYVKESGDFDFYKKVLPYADKGSDPVFKHLRRAIEFNIQRSGAHGLPCGLHADWNDCLRLGEKGESVFVAFQLRFGLREYIEIARRLNEVDEEKWAEIQLKKLDENIEKYCWDGEWYIRGYRFDGFKFGSKDSEEGKIFVNPQSWAVISGHASGERAQKIIKAVEKHLSTEYGVMLCSPPFIKTDPQVCLARLMNPGLKENASIFNHTQGWFIIAEALAGRNEEAWQHLKAVLPSTYNNKAEIRKVEPYVVCQFTSSKFSKSPGTGNVSWLSGSAAWNYYVMTNIILGIKPDYDGLQISPCIPSHWNGFTVKRIFRDCEFRIEVKRGTAKKERQMIVNGEKINSNIIPAEKFKKVNQVRLIF